MSSINKVILVGTVGKDPEIKYMPSGDAVVNLSIATSESWKDKTTGEKREATEWHNITFYGGLAKVVGDYVRKGQLLYIEGSLKTRSWDKDGQKHYRTEVNASEMKMLGGKRDGGERDDSDRREQQQPARQQQTTQQRQAPAPQGRGGFGGGTPRF